MRILQDLYDSEINFSISTFWDGGFYWKLGDEINGFRAEGSCDFAAMAEAALAREAMIHFPNSEFAKKYRDILA